MKRSILIGSSVLGLIVLLAAGAFVGGRLLGAASETGGAGSFSLSSGNGGRLTGEFVQAEEYPDSDPEVLGAFSRRQDNSLFIDKTKDGFTITRNEDGSMSVANATGEIVEVVVTGQTVLYVDSTFENPEAAMSDGKLYQQLGPGSIDEIGELSFVRAWGEMRGDRLIAATVVYSRAPVLSR